MITGLVGYGYWGKIIDSKLPQNLLEGNFDRAKWIFIATPPPSHYELVKKYLNEFKNVFCEKPLTLDFVQAEELIKISKENNVRLYTDNIFLLRDEIRNTKLIPCENITFNWFKKGPFKDSLVNDLLYHDLYLLIHFMGVEKISGINYIKNTNSLLKIEFTYGKVRVKINYDRDRDGEKTKNIITDHQIIDLSNPYNDPLQESIDLCLSDKMDFESNQKMTLETMKLLTYFIKYKK